MIRVRTGLLTGLLVLGSVLVLDARQLTTTERQRLAAHLEMTSSWLLDEVAALNAKQLAFKRTPEEWNIAQVLDHLVLVGSIYWNDLQAALKSPPSARESGFSDSDILWYGIDRSNREKAIASEVPAGRLRSVQELIGEYRENSNRLLQFIQTTQADLRAHYVPRQSSDAYQWALLISSHEQRHILQIREIKAHKNFPRR